MYLALPAPMKIYGAVENTLSCPVTVRDGRGWLEEFTSTHPVNTELIPKTEKSESKVAKIGKNQQ